MPTLPDKTALGGLPNADTNRPMVQLSPNTPDAGAMGLDMLGQGVKKIAGGIRAKIEEADDYDVQKALIDFDLAQEKKLDDAKRSAAPEAKGFTDGYRQSYDGEAMELMKRVPDRLKPKLDQILVERGARFEKRAYDFELAERDRYHVEDVNTKLTDIYNDSMSAPDRHLENAQRGVALLRSSKLSQRAKLKAEREFLERNEEYAVRSLADRYAAEGRDITPLLEDIRKVPRGSWRREGDVKSGMTGEGTIDLIKRFEGDKDNGWDVAQYSGPYGVKRGANERLTLEEADRRLRVEVAEVEAAMNSKIKVPINENQRAALTSLFYNIGTGKGRLDQVAAMINAGEIDRVPGWIRQFDKAAGKTLPGLQRRRAEEADLFRRAAPLGDMPEGKVELTDRRSGPGAASEPVERAELPMPATTSGDPPKPKINPETGEPIPDIGVDKSDMPKLDKPGMVANGPDEPYEHDEVPYKHLSPTARRKLINVLRTHSRAQLSTEVTDDIERIRLGRAPKLGPDNRTSLDRARATLPPIQFREIADKWKEAELEHQAIAPLRSMPREQMYDHAVSVVNRAEGNEESLRVARKVQQKAEREVEKIVKLRETDPVRSVNGYLGEETDERRPPLKHTQEAMRQIAQSRQPELVVKPDGTAVPYAPGKSHMTPHQQWETMFEARLRDQQEIMPDEPEKHRIIDRRQAERLLKIPKDGKGLDDRTFRAKLTEAAARAEQEYGPKYAKRVMQEAISFHLSGGSQDHKDMQASILRKMISGEPILVDDVQKMRSLDQLRQSGLQFGTDAMAGIDRVGRPNVPTMAPQGDPGRPAIAQTFVPTQRHTEWLMQNPDGWQAFDEKFGPGSAARILGGGASTGGNRRDLSKAKPGSPEARAAADTKPKDKGWFGR